VQTDPLNTIPIQQFLQAVKNADNSRAKELRLELQTAKNLAYTLGIVMARLNGDLEKYVQEYARKADEEVIQVQMDGGDLST
jgi:hypothetical protein